MRPKILSANDAAGLIPDGATVTVSASSGVSLPDAMLAALGERFRQAGSPRGLRLLFPINLGDMFGQKGLDHLANDGQVACLIGGSFPSGPSHAEPPAIRRLIAEERCLSYNYPIGVLTALLSESAAKGPGVLTRTGIGTFVDDRHGGGGMNERSRAKPYVRRVQLEGEEYLFFPALGVDVAIIRATTADEQGNLTFEHEGAIVSPFTMAAAAKTNGGKVIAQVKRLLSSRHPDPRDVKVPGYMVDAVVVVPDQMQATRTLYDPAISGQDWAAPDRLPGVEDPVERLLARRVAGQIHPGNVAVLGYGVCANVPTLLAQSGEIDEVSFLIEQGTAGGIPLTGFQFGCSYNAKAYLDTRLNFDYLRGGGFDIALLSFLEVDGAGNLNVSSLPSRPHVTAGIGGFMDIVQNAPRLVFAGQLRSSGDMAVTPEGLAVRSEGKHAKFVAEVSQVTVPAAVLHRGDRDVRFMTERCILRLTADGLELIEILPGLDPQRHVTALCDIPIRIAENLRRMDPRLLQAEAGRLLGATDPDPRA